MKLGMKLLQVAAALLLALSVPAQGGEGHGTDPAHGAALADTMDTPNSDFFQKQFVHLMPHELALGESPYLTFYNINGFQVGVVLAIALLFGLVASSFRGSGQAPWILRVFRGWCLWIRDDVVTPVMGAEDARKWTPLFLYLFFFIAFSNVIGLVPGSATATACLFVTGAMAVITLAIMLVGGMMTQGVVAFWKNLLPHGLPVALIPLMAVIEVAGLFIKPVALTIRLFANMLAGHLLIYSFIGLLFVLAKMFEMSPVTYVTAIPVVGMAVFINIIEALVVLLQAYIFCYLSVLFIQQSMHPAH